MIYDDATVHIVDDDPSVRHALAFLLESRQLQVASYESAEQFLQQAKPISIGCLILDVRMGGMSGLELQSELQRRATTLPIIMLTGHGDVPMAVRAMSEGAFDFIQKPFNGPQLLEKVETAIILSRELFGQQQARESLRQRYRELTRREREVMARIVRGEANKVIAIELGIGIRTVEVHRHRVMEKMGVQSVADLVHADIELHDDT